MNALTSVVFSLGVIAYSVAMTLFFVDIARRTRRGPARRWATRLLRIAALAHFAHIVVTSLITGICPIYTVEFALSLTALVAVAGFLILGRSEPIHALGAFIAPLAITFLVGAQVVGGGYEAGQLSRGVLAVHVTASLLGAASFLLAAGAGLFYLVAERRLKSKRLVAAGGKLPPLDVLDRVEHRFLLAGFPMLTLGIVTAAVFGTGGHVADGKEVARSLLAYGSWGLVAMVLVLRTAAGWRGRKAAYGTLAGAIMMVMVLLVYLAGDRLGGLS